MTNDTSKAETAREIALLVSELIATGVMFYAAYKSVVSADTQRTIRMGMARTVARFATAQEEHWGTLARRAHTYYWQTANVTS